MPHQTDCNRNTLLCQEAAIIIVCNTPNLAQDVRWKFGTLKDLYGYIARKDADFLGISLSEYLIYESKLCGRRHKVGRHCVDRG